MASGFLFDLDGTLVTLKIDADQMRRRLMDELRKRGIDTSGIDGRSATSQSIIDVGIAAIRSGKVHEGEREFRGRINSTLDELELAWGRDSSPIAGTMEALERLKAIPVKTAAVTNSGRVPASFVLGRYGLDRYLDAIVTRDDVDAMKPSPEGIIKALGLIGVEKEDALFVGDSWVDVRAARSAGVRIAAVISGRYGEERLRAEHPDYILRSLGELEGMVTERNQDKTSTR